FPIFSVGHSTHSWEDFLRLLRSVSITAIADVRSAPFSRHFPHFSQKDLSVRLNQVGIAYAFLGNELGGRPREQEFYCDGIADYEKMATTDTFRRGIDRVVQGAHKYRIALMCSEHDPLECHRCLLVGRRLFNHGFSVQHLLATGVVRTHD